MRRREILLLCCAWLAWPISARGQPQRVAKIGVLAAGPVASRQGAFSALIGRLHELGWDEGSNLAIEYRSSDGDSGRFSYLAAELAHLRVDTILALGTPAAIAAQHATAGAIPIVMNVGDAIGTGLVSSLARPAGNITGVSDLTAELSAKRLDSLREMVPGLSRLAVLWTAANPGASLAFEETTRAARGLGLDVQPLPVRAPEELERVLRGASLLATTGGALVVVQDPLTLTYRRQIVDLVTEIRLPAIYGFREFVDVGGLMSYAADLRDIYRTLATLVDRILRGTQASDLPVEQPTKFELVVNLKAAKAIGITVPPTLLARADEVIE